MGLVSVPMTFGKGVRCTQASLPLIGQSYAKVVVGADARFRGPKFSIAYRFKLIPGAFFVGTQHCRVAIHGTALDGRTLELMAMVDAGANFTIRAAVSSLACGFLNADVATPAKNTTEHSLVWTYDEDENMRTYYDGGLVDTRAALCSDISNNVAAGDWLEILGNSDLGNGNGLFDMGQVHYLPDVMTSDQVTTFHNTGTF